MLKYPRLWVALAVSLIACGSMGLTAANAATVTCGHWLPSNNTQLGFAADNVVTGSCVTGTTESGGAPSPPPAGVVLIEQLNGDGTFKSGTNGALTVTFDASGQTLTGFWEGTWTVNTGYTNLIFALSDGQNDPRW